MSYENYLSRDIANVNVKRNNKYQKMINLLVYGDSEEGVRKKENQIFPHIKDLIIFAAMVGKNFNCKEILEKETTGITIATFAGSGQTKDSKSDQHNIIFMFGLLEFKDMNFIRDEKIHESVKLFEEYSNGGLSIIQGWLIESKWNPMILLDKIQDEIVKSIAVAGLEVEYNPF
jgi:dnd system-associated protein 4